MEKSYRIRANVGKDQVLNVNLQRGVDLYEVLSLKIKQEKLYKLHSSGYGVIIGRVLANDAFGIPNAKVSVFIPITNQDKLRTDLKELYPYKSVTSYDRENRRFNTLPNYKKSKCHKPVGTFPKKRMVLDEDLVLEVYDKYYKYTTVTNKSGDYMIFGVPTGEQIVHVDLDLSDIGVLSQRPSDFIYKGYSINLFDSASEFKTSTNLSDLPQIISEDVTVNVYPFWGDKSENEIAITRKDVRVQYKFEPTCVFLGSVVADSSDNSISHNCSPSTKMGELGQLVSSEGTIEMIRKTIDDRIEEFNIKGNQLIDENGVWCYQIPMNLDYVRTDEYGNIVPTDNPRIGIPTRARVRFRISLNENGGDGLSSHKARYLVPNNPELYAGEKIVEPFVKTSCLDSASKNNNYYEFGTLTNDECFRDLLWNKVYSVKSFIPRIQKQLSDAGEKSEEYIGIKGINKKTADGVNPFPFNKLNLNYSISAFQILRQLWDADNYFYGFWHFLNGNQYDYSIDAAREKILEENDAIGLDFYNDWVNGCLYFPNWYWHVDSDKSSFCDCDKNLEEGLKLCVLNNCSLVYKNDDLMVDEANNNPKDVNYMMTKNIYGSKKFDGGIVKKVINKNGASIYYYSFGQKQYPGNKAPTDPTEYSKYVRLFSTDIILLGSLSDCDIHGIPKVSSKLPSTTATIPPIGSYKPQVTDNPEIELSESDLNVKESKGSVNGMNWGEYWLDEDGNPREPIKDRFANIYWGKLSSGLFFGFTKLKFREIYSLWHFILMTFFNKQTYIYPATDIKTCVNAERICELGVSNDTEYILEGKDIISTSSPIQVDKAIYRSRMDGLITRKEIQDIETRSLFATLNSRPLNVEIPSETTGYKTYTLFYLYPSNFDGRMEKISKEYTSDATTDARCKDYLDFRFGTVGYASSATVCANTSGGLYRCDEIDIPKKERHFYGDVVESTESSLAYTSPLYENSFYFYFGLNPAHTAISEFTKNFMSECYVKELDPFTVNITQNASDICGEENGTIKIEVDGVIVPYSIYVESKEKQETFSSIYDLEYLVDNLSNGDYSVTIADSVGQSITKKVTLKQENIKVNYTIVNQLQIKYSEGQKSTICANEQYAVIQIDSYTLNGTTYSVSNLGTANESNELTFTNEYFIIKFSVISSTDNDIRNYLCGYDGNKLYFGKPGNFSIRIAQNNCPGNYSDSTFSITDSGDMDLYINQMPLKFFVGLNENKISDYAKWFHNSDNPMTPTSVRGWFGVHDPNTYDQAFYGNSTTGNYKDIWENENSVIGSNDTLLSKFKMLFNVASATYVGEGTTNKFSATSNGGKTLIRAAYPKYGEIIPTDGVGGFSSYITCNKPETDPNGVNASPNIVGSNYTFRDTATQPSGDIKFNPKYSNATNCAGNYFAAFSNNANYIDSCTKSETGKKCIVIPFGANDLSSEGLCVDKNSSKAGMLSEVYTNPYRYFRTEFIDRRLDYDFAYVTPCSTADNSSNDRIWANGRLSGITYNGIEMAYNGNYVITSNDSNTEYNYNESTKEISLKNNLAKRLYSSELNYGGSKPLDLRELYYCKKRTSISENTFGNDGIKVHNHSGDDFSTDKGFDNFGVTGTNKDITGYPTKRLLDIYNIPYGNGVYEWKSASCFYPSNITDYKDLKAVKLNDVSHSINFENSLSTVINNISYKISNASSYEFSANEYNTKFTLRNPSVANHNSKIEKVKLIVDDENHSKLKQIKTGRTSSLESIFDSITVGENYAGNPGTIEIYKNNLSNTKFIGIGLQYTLENSLTDNLLGRIRLFNLSNYYNASKITFRTYDPGNGWIEKIEKEFEVDKDTIVISGSTEAGGEIEVSGETIEISTEGGINASVESNPTGSNKIEKLNFFLETDAFDFDEINSVNMEVTMGTLSNYTPSVENYGYGVRVSVTLTNSSQSINDQPATIKTYFVLRNGIKYVLPFIINKDGVISNIS